MPLDQFAHEYSACDGELLYSVFINADGLHVTATNLAGKIVWQKEAGAFKSEHGYGSSPVLYKSLVIVKVHKLETAVKALQSIAAGRDDFPHC